MATIWEIILEWFRAFRGFPQYSCLRPLIWLLIADHQLKLYKYKAFYLLEYADDFVLIDKGNTQQDLEITANYKIKIFYYKCNTRNLHFYEEKSIVVLCGKKDCKTDTQLSKLMVKQ